MKATNPRHIQNRKNIIVWLGSYIDQPGKIFQQKRSFEVARTPFFDQLMRESKTGFVQIIDKFLPYENATTYLKLFSDFSGVHQNLVGKMEALGLGIQVPSNYSAFRCDLVTVANQMLLEWTSGCIGSEESRILIQTLEKELSNEKLQLVHSGANRNILLIHDDLLEGGGGELQCAAPGDVYQKPVELNFPKGKGSEFIANIMRQSINVFQQHEVNQIRLDLGENPASMVWIWGGGKIKTDDIKAQPEIATTLITHDPQMRGAAQLLNMETQAFDLLSQDGFDKDLLQRYLDNSKVLVLHLGLPIERELLEDTTHRMKRIETWDKRVLPELVEKISAYPHKRVLFLLMPKVWDASIKDVPYILWGDDIQADKGPVTKLDLFYKKRRAIRKNKLWKYFLG